MKAKYYVTTPIYYVNGSPHIGHAYTSIAADVLARFNRLDGKNVFFLSGVDEHGQKVEKAAAAAGLAPQLFVDNLADEFRAITGRLDISVDDFIRTTEHRHRIACVALWNMLVDAGQIYLGSYSGWYSVRDEAFYTEDELVSSEGGGRFAPTGADVEWVSEPSYFFRLSHWQDALLALFEREPDFIRPASKRNEIVAFVQAGLKDLSISRMSFSWGIEVPGDPGHVMYVWFDALVNYISALGWPDQVGSGSRWQQFWPADLHVVGKEIIRFHAVYWTAILMAAGLALPKLIFSHGWWTVDGQKISKSLGNGVDPRPLADEFGVDALRFFLLREVPFGGDGDFSRRALIHRMNSELANDLGNLAQRTLSLVARQLEGRRPAEGISEPEDELLLEKSAALPGLCREHLSRLAFGDALEEVWRVVRAGNGYIDAQAPWRLARVDPGRMAVVLRVLLDCLRSIATCLLAFMPSSMGRLLDQLGVADEERRLADLTRRLPAGAVLPPPVAIFPRHVEATR